MAKIKKIDIRMVDLQPESKRVDATQSFVSQETIFVTIEDEDGCKGTGYSYTIGSGGYSILALLQRTLIPCIIGQDADRIEQVWQTMLFSTHATSVGAITALSMAAVDIALWDLRCKKLQLPLWVVAGGSQKKIPLYSTEGGWLHLDKQALIDDALQMKEKGFKGSKIKIGKKFTQDDERLFSLRQAVGDDYEIMVDANQSFCLSDAIRWATMLHAYNVYWFEEPLRADDILSHAELAKKSPVPIAVGESMYSLSQFKDYLQLGAAHVIQVDVARIGGITPWLKTAHLAQANNTMVCPHFLMELHISLVCAISNAKWLEYIPQLNAITQSSIHIENGYAIAPQTPGIGIDWDWEKITKIQIEHHSFIA